MFPMPSADYRMLFSKSSTLTVAVVVMWLNCSIIFAASTVSYSKSTLGLYDISTFDVYVDGRIIHIIAGGKKTANDQQLSIRYTRSEDDGRHWKNPVTLDIQLSEVNASRGNDIQLATKDKRLVALWQSQGALPGMGPMAGAYSLDNGRTWQQSLNPAGDNDGSQAYIDLIADLRGNFHVVWLEDPDENGYQSLRYARSIDSGQQWSQPVTLDDSTCSCCPNTFALSPKNELSVLYRDMTPRDMSLLQSSDSGLTWRRINTVGNFDWNFKGCPHVGGGLGYIENDDVAQLHSVVWTGVEEKPGLYYLSSSNNGETWSIPARLGEAAIHGDIAALDSRKVFAIWNEMEAEGLSVFYAVSEDGGASWLKPKRLTEAGNAATHPKLVSTRQGVLAMWTEKPSKQPSRLAWQIFK